ncbi:hypothetical protein [Helicobacter canis]|uniref:Uncharacterized protein n=1 Tax=Helicobacter canis NCTC 12740 TaxID=1357399 RepID=V8CJU0_9HELI|nr:hypothetical protein [Helicobacter canis]ETD27357.1 hypothetical protein HMPREF2087_00269 [Helicobacter canis NCTC 12740]
MRELESSPPRHCELCEAIYKSGLPRLAQGKARNDKKRASFLNTPEILQKQLGGRIFDEKAGLRWLLCGDKTWVSIAQAKGKLPALSQKANAKTRKE